MRTARPRATGNPDPVEYWDELLRPLLKKSPELAKTFLEEVRAAKLTFGKRVHCPFLRPVFLSPQDEERVRRIAEAIAAIAERITSTALEDTSLFQQFHLRPEEERLVRLNGGYIPASAASRLDAFLLPESLKFTEYNGESPAGAGYSESLSDIFLTFPVMQEFKKRFEVHSYPLSAKLLDALVGTYVDWGGKSKRPQMAIVDWKEVPTWTEFEILKDRFERMGIPVELADPRELEFDGKRLIANGKSIELLYRRVLINDIVARPKECEAIVNAHASGAVCVANNFRCKISHVKAFFAVLTDEKNARYFSSDERDLIQRHVPWTRVVADAKTEYDSEPIELLDYIRKNQKNLVMKPSDEYGGKGVTLGWEVEKKEWENAIEQALPGGKATKELGCWIVQERIPMRRGTFPFIGKGNKVEFKNMLVDFAPYLFRGKVAGYLTRLSSTSLANVTSGGGQIPSFRVEPKRAERRASAGRS
ncbi:MAG TPA: hypothetical protein VK703_08810 [Candidatus Acidoferrales bacterium]|jgi:uncharacterized circularly permuted ATP-grasp superfamily protein|nr:hypothetical protein [Candidatus Acidoferrales bacterium]